MKFIGHNSGDRSAGISEYTEEVEIIRRVDGKEVPLTEDEIDAYKTFIGEMADGHGFTETEWNLAHVELEKLSQQMEQMEIQPQPVQEIFYGSERDCVFLSVDGLPYLRERAKDSAEAKKRARKLNRGLREAIKKGSTIDSLAQALISPARGEAMNCPQCNRVLTMDLLAKARFACPNCRTIWKVMHEPGKPPLMRVTI